MSRNLGGEEKEEKNRELEEGEEQRT